MWRHPSGAIFPFHTPRFRLHQPRSKARLAATSYALMYLPAEPDELVVGYAQLVLREHLVGVRVRVRVRVRLGLGLGLG